MAGKKKSFKKRFVCFNPLNKKKAKRKVNIVHFFCRSVIFSCFDLLFSFLSFAFNSTFINS